jgi:outer membrane lipoprotein SlyB
MQRELRCGALKEKCMTSFAKFGAAALFVAFASGCASHRPPPPPTYGYSQQVQYGTVQNIDMVRAQNQTSGGGAIVGGVIGGLLGHQVDHGAKKDLATGIGVVGGAIIGNQIEKNRAGAQDIYRVTIRLDNGGQRSFDYAQLSSDLRVGDRVRVDNNQVYRW